ncbi:histidine triad nucleotide-binding protein [Spiribacter roseus]|uniref:histidine triad nucleotide-binding protein n=1 Tax=Spiribacter roseus TaxID=1855875 RepID=UPI000F6C9AE6|nr:histidine triad nucleotide-binding protein [Spiribacter roseus]
MSKPCIFCEIVAGRMDADVIHRDDQVVAFHDIHPQAPTHVLIIPRRHIESMVDIQPDDASLIGHMHLTAKKLAHELEIADTGYRSIFNCGRDAGQTVWHIHLHLMGGRSMGWPPWPGN